MNKLKKFLSVFLILTFMLLPSSSLAQETPPTPPPAPVEPTAPPAPENKETPPPAPTPPPSPTAPVENQSSSSNQTPATDGTNQSVSGNQGDTTITTGDATTTANSSTLGNNNSSSSQGIIGSSGNTVVNEGNGTASSNNSSASSSGSLQNNQTNNGEVINNINGATITGSNSATSNIGNTSINSGDANTTGTAVTAINSNAQGLLVAEFNVVDDKNGDIILDFVANCISGCPGANQVSNTGNGSFSENTATSSGVVNSDNFQKNDSTVGNNLTLSADSGGNKANLNTGGNTSITTGNANVSGNAITLANNNIGGKIVYGVVNIFGDLVGDIILPTSAIEAVTNSATNSGNGSFSENSSIIGQNQNSQSTQENNGQINNNLNLSTNTGQNSNSLNTGGNSSTTTGDASVTAKVLNVLNSNIEGSNVWLVLINRSGQWIGKILGAPEGSTLAGSSGTEISTNEKGEVVVSNEGNGTASNNNAAVTQNNTSTSTQKNDAQVDNNLNLSANTGKNSTSMNTGGDSSIKTGDATVIANIVNFVNNNIHSNSKLVTTVVNVFGSWIGNFVAPGQKKEDSPTKASNSETTAKLNISSEQNNDQTDSESDSNNINPQGNTSLIEPLSDESSIFETSLNNWVAINNGGHGPTAQNFENTSPVNQLSTQSTSSQIETPGKVLANMTMPSQEIKSQVVRINLAWLAIIIPLAISMFYLKRKFI